MKKAKKIAAAKVETRGVKSKFTDAEKRAILRRVFDKDGEIKEYGIKTKVAKKEHIHTRTIDYWKADHLKAAYAEAA